MLNYSLQQIEVVFRDKTNATQTALREVLISERTALAEENRVSIASNITERLDDSSFYATSS